MSILRHAYNRLPSPRASSHDAHFAPKLRPRPLPPRGRARGRGLDRLPHARHPVEPERRSLLPLPRIRIYRTIVPRAAAAPEPAPRPPPPVQVTRPQGRAVVRPRAARVVPRVVRGAVRRGRARVRERRRGSRASAGAEMLVGPRARHPPRERAGRLRRPIAAGSSSSSSSSAGLLLLASASLTRRARGLDRGAASIAPRLRVARDVPRRRVPRPRRPRNEASG